VGGRPRPGHPPQFPKSSEMGKETRLSGEEPGEAGRASERRGKIATPATPTTQSSFRRTYALRVPSHSTGCDACASKLPGRLSAASLETRSYLGFRTCRGCPEDSGILDGLLFHFQPVLVVGDELLDFVRRDLTLSFGLPVRAWGNALHRTSRGLSSALETRHSRHLHRSLLITQGRSLSGGQKFPSCNPTRSCQNPTNFRRGLAASSPRERVDIDHLAWAVAFQVRGRNGGRARTVTFCV
jgi:hypothetical protein